MLQSRVIEEPCGQSLLERPSAKPSNASSHLYVAGNSSSLLYVAGSDNLTHKSGNITHTHLSGNIKHVASLLHIEAFVKKPVPTYKNSATRKRTLSHNEAHV